MIITIGYSINDYLFYLSYNYYILPKETITYFLKELSLISNPNVHSRLIVILRLELAVAVLCLHANLWQRIIIDAACEYLLACIFLRTAKTRIVVLNMTEHIELLLVGTKLCYLREDVVAKLKACGYGV